MGYIKKRGSEAIDSAQTEQQDYSKSIKSLKSGTSFKVRVPSVDEVAEVYMHSVFNVFYSTPCVTREDFYDKAVDLLYADKKKATEAGNEDLADQYGKHAYALKAKPRYLFGFINLEDGEPIIIDLSKKQAQGIMATTAKYKKRLSQLAFEISKTGSGQSTSVTLNPLMFLEEDLTDKEREHFAATEGKAIPEDVYEKCLYVKTDKEIAQDVLDYEAYAKKGSKQLPSIDLQLDKRLGLSKVAGAVEEPPAPVDEEDEGNYGF